VGDFRYVLVGGGMTAAAAAKGIRELDADGSIGLVGAELNPPYARPPLSKGLWTGKDESSIWRGTEEQGVELLLGRTVVSLDLEARRVADDRGESHGYEKLLLATGGTPRMLPSASGEVVYFRTLDDYRRLREVAGEGRRVVVIGGGFIGSEVAAALQGEGCAVTIVFPERGIGARIFPAELASFVNGYYVEKGVEVLPGELVETVEPGAVRLGSGRTLDAELVVAGLGIVPNDELAAAAGLATEDGIVVDDRGRAGRDDVFSAGDVARFPATALGVATRVEHENHAVSQGKQVGRNMAGADEPYDHLPFFYSDLFELGYEAVGETDPQLRTIAEWAEPNRKGVVAYLDDASRPRGFLLWDVWGKVDPATQLIRAAEPIDEVALRALL
jgi:3-phenylpropionate/trans-cinnamate dioxygenase ferredoxin reductase subunit